MKRLNLILYFTCIIYALCFLSCQKEVKINLTSAEEQLVVTGYIQERYPTYVFLSKSQYYFAPIDDNTLLNIAIHDAKVSVERNDGISHNLTFVSQSLIDSLNLPIDSLELPFPGIFVDLRYQEDNFTQIGYNYKLQIIWRGDTITSTTSIPPKYPIDSIWVERKDNISDTHKCYIWAQMQDPDTIGNYFTVYFKRDVRWKPMDPLFIGCARSVRSDLMINGESYTTYFARSGRWANDEDGVFLPFDTERIIDGQLVKNDIVLLRIAHINENTYKFWRSVERMSNSNNNPFSEPMNLSSNINNGLGIWAGYGISYYYVPIIPETVIYNDTNIALYDIF